MGPSSGRQQTASSPESRGAGALSPGPFTVQVSVWSWGGEAGAHAATRALHSPSRAPVCF